MSESLTGNEALFAASSSSTAALATFIVYSVVIIALAWLSHKVLANRKFLSEYFLGSRGLGVLAFTLTYGATSASVGSFAGFPSLIYRHGWVLALWIASYMLVPLCGMGLIGKRLNQISRKTGAITVPDVLRARFESPAIGLLSTVMIAFMLLFYLIPQFKIASIIVQKLLGDVPLFNKATVALSGVKQSIPWLQGVETEYLLCLLMFAVLVVIYTTIGGFRAVVWTDVLQGFVMIFGVIVMLVLTLWHVGGLNNATNSMSRMIPPRVGTMIFEVDDPAPEKGYRVPGETWFTLPGANGELRLLRTNKTAEITAGETTSDKIPVVEIMTPEEKEETLAQFEDGVPAALPAEVTPRILVNSIVLHFQSRASDPPFDLPAKTFLMATDPVTLEPLVLKTKHVASVIPSTGQSGTIGVEEIIDPDELEKQMAKFRVGLLLPIPSDVKPELIKLRDYKHGAGKRGVYVSGPGPSLDNSLGFHPFGMAISFFFFWSLSGTGQPGNMVRLMAFDSARTLRRSLCLLTVYFGLIYFPLVVIFCCARVIEPGLDQVSDRIMPVMAFTLSEAANMPWLAGILVAAPFAAAMSTVDSFMLMISSSVVRDVYQQHVNPQASERRMRRLSFLCIVIVGIVVMIAAVKPPPLLQKMIVFTGGGLGVTFLIPMLMAMYWPRVNKPGFIAAMTIGFATYLALYAVNLLLFEKGNPLRPLGLDPLIWGFAGSLLGGIIVTLVTAPPPEHLVRKFFYRGQ